MFVILVQTGGRIVPVVADVSVITLYGLQDVIRRRAGNFFRFAVGRRSEASRKRPAWCEIIAAGLNKSEYRRFLSSPDAQALRAASVPIQTVERALGLAGNVLVLV